MRKIFRIWRQRTIFHHSSLCPVSRLPSSVSRLLSPFLLSHVFRPKSADSSLMSTVICLSILSHFSYPTSPVSCLLSHVSCLTSPVSRLLSHVSCLLSPVSYIMSPVSRLLSHVSHVSCLTSPVSRLLSHVSCLTSPGSRLLSHVSSLTSPISRLLTFVSCLLSDVPCLRCPALCPTMLNWLARASSLLKIRFFVF